MEHPSVQGDVVPPYAVVLVQYEDLTDGHEHVSHVETLDPDGGQTRWTCVEVINAIRGGERFVVTIGGTATGATLEPAICPVCPLVTLNYRSH
jgi:hypothetical protein